MRSRSLATRIKRSIAVLSVTGLVLGLLVVVAPTALAACNGQFNQAAVGAFNDRTPNYGAKSGVWVNNFDSHQLQSWRAVGLYQSSSQFVEVGWVTSEGFDDQLAHPYKTKMNNGTSTTYSYEGQTLSRDNMHTFEIVDIDDDNFYWSYVDGDGLGGKMFVSINPNQTIAMTQSERGCTGDSMWAQFRNLRYVNVNGNPVAWSDKTALTAGNHSPYDYCHISADGYDVRQTC